MVVMGFIMDWRRSAMVLSVTILLVSHAGVNGLHWAIPLGLILVRGQCTARTVFWLANRGDITHRYPD